VKQLLLIESDSSLSKLIRLNVMKSFDLNVIEKDSVEEAIDLLEILPDIELVILRESEKHNTLFDYIQKNNPELPVLLNGKTVHSHKKITQLSSENSWSAIVEWTGKILGLQPLASFSQSNSEFVPVPISYFLNIHETSMGCDVYIRVKKGDDYQYIKRLNSTDFFERVDIEKYASAGLQEFYIKKDHFDSFVNFVTDKLILQLGDKTSTVKDKIQLGSEVYDVIADRIQVLGIDERTVEIVTESVNAMQSTLGQGNALADFLKLMMQNKLGHGYAHSFLNCLLLNTILKSFDWNSHLTKEKITFLSYFHDISLKLDESEKFHNRADLSKEENHTLQHHALKSAEIVEKFPQSPIGIGPLIREHHGSKTGVGLNEGLSIAISPISMAFIVVEDFAGEFMQINGVPTLSQVDKIFERILKVYTKGTYLQAAQALQQAIVKKPA